MTADKERFHILMLGEALERPGGVVTVEKATLAAAPDRLSFHHIPTLPAEGRFGPARKLLTLLRAVVAMAVRLSVHPVDVVHIHVSMGASITRKCLLAQLAFLAGKPVVMHTHGGAFAEHYPAMPSGLRRFVARTFRHCAAVITLAETWRRVYIETLKIEPARAVILKNPVNLPSQVPVRHAAVPIRLLYLGMLSGPKGAFDLIEAMAGLGPDDQSRLHLTMAGHGEIDAVKGRIASLDLEEVITVRGWVNAEERDALLAKTDVLILPSHFEGLPMALLEAMSFGIPSIATPVGGIPDVLRDGENGLLVPPGDQAALADAIRHLLLDGVLRQRLGAQARLSVEPYAADGYARALIDIYESVTADGLLANA